MPRGKNPAFLYYPKDWRADAIFGCSLAAKGLWLEMMNMMHASERYGYLSNNGAAIPDEAIVRYCGCTLQEYQTLLPELERAGVPRRTPNGIIYCKRMVDDQKGRTVWRKEKQNQRVTHEKKVVHQLSGALPFPSSFPIPKESSNNKFSQDAAAVAITPEETAAAFKSFEDLGVSEPFGDRKFQLLWVSKYKKLTTTPHDWVTPFLEETIVEGQASGIGIPPLFYELKHDVEKLEREDVKRRMAAKA